MRRLLGFLLRAAVVVGLVLWLADQPGTARIVWHGYVIESSAAVLGLGTFIIAFVFYLLFRFWHLLRHGPKLWNNRRKFKKLQAGQDFLTQGLVAVAGGNATEAGRLALAARKKLGTTTATLLLQAQAAQLAHDHRTARAIFRAMIETPESAILGYRGLIMEARRGHKWDEVESLTAEAARLQVDMPWLDQVRFEIATRRENWEEAGEALARLGSSQLIEAESLRQHRAALLVAQSQEAARLGLMPTSLELAEKAAKQMPNWLPALINLAERQATGNYPRAARRTVEKAWKIQPHPALADALKSIDQDAMAIYKQVARLCEDEENPANHLALAEVALVADLWGEARRHLMLLITKHEATQAAYRLLSRLERRESGDERAALQWLTKAGNAPADPAWLCTACGSAHTNWQAICRSCGTFATLDWRSPHSGYLSLRSHAPLLSDWSE